MQSLEGMDLKLFPQSRTVNESIVEHAVKRIASNVTQSMGVIQISILGCAFKGSPPTADIRGSLIYRIKECLEAKIPNSDFRYHDYLAEQVNAQDQSLNASDNLKDIISAANVIILQNNNPNYAKLNWDDLLSNAAKDCVIYDFWSQLNPKALENYNYICFGEG